MNNPNFNLARLLWDNGLQKLVNIGKNQWVQVAVLIVLFYLVGRNDVSFNFSKAGAQSANILDNGILYGTPFGTASTLIQPVSKTVADKPEKQVNNWYDDIKERSGQISNQLNLANEATAVGAALSAEEKAMAAKLSNLSIVFNSEEYFRKNNIPKTVVDAKRKTCEAYILKYAQTAREEAEIFNIPASITLAQGLLESNAGESQLARKENNHFGIKCRTKCLGCRCANYTDDDRYDMFRIFDSAWHSFREHSKLLSGDRYKYLTKLNRNDYKNWARGLKAAGYATDKKYAEKLIKIIEHFSLHKYDN